MIWVQHYCSTTLYYTKWLDICEKRGESGGDVTWLLDIQAEQSRAVTGDMLCTVQYVPYVSQNGGLSCLLSMIQWDTMRYDTRRCNTRHLRHEAFRLLAWQMIKHPIHNKGMQRSQYEVHCVGRHSAMLHNREDSSWKSSGCRCIQTEWNEMRKWGVKWGERKCGLRVRQGRTFAPVLIALVEVIHVYPLGHSLSNRVPQGRGLIIESGYAGSERVPVNSGLG